MFWFGLAASCFLVLVFGVVGRRWCLGALCAEVWWFCFVLGFGFWCFWWLLGFIVLYFVVLEFRCFRCCVFGFCDFVLLFWCF